MRVLVCGGRDYANRRYIHTVLDMLHQEHGITTIIEGGARGADRIGGEWAEKNHINHMIFEAMWRRYGGSAGFRRNQKMLDKGHPDLVLAFGGGRGTNDMVRISRRANVPVEEFERG